ncbi:CRISPR system precrRNA processing endoribonuclease RAMP protein Cas6 [Aliarcobacter butzleri]|uniref:CRISPR system precrRNA processing endoribonuclease RAMP protein Cas6 n=1 Tax=Aliarcobacter butzleri TaxID=28197 RepID=UPI0021B3DE34|nr:CRISPR system precrRNA processing endoribonuclease RAMP protein Cas6 [Aliarcobacter butzleri]MCT7606847.1 CRISPR system precrRNA processing endoribonuclease RAMP protein Cas6 [Aliarcobacter butzleri]MCT7646382.1 CRISPR system precrRNA processing endoribonuclease RAMP protein Cas6 [Aliarcobacter butzleri]
MNYTKLSLIIKSKQKPPYFIGSQIRGAFGYALKNIVKQQDLDENIYNKFFEQKDVTHKYRFDIRLGLQSYEFSFYLFDDACDEVYNCISAFHELFTKVGLGKNNNTYEEFEIYVNKKIVYKNGNLEFFDDYTKKYKESKYKKEFILRLETPLRIKKDGKYIIDDSLELESIINSIYQRNLALQNKDFEKLPFKPRFEIKSKDIYFNDIKRFSSVQNTSMQLGGVMGEMWISNLDEQSFMLLKLGELIGVGKQTVFGLGKISVGAVR